MMPPMSPPQSGNNSPSERPEASDLLNPDGTPWASPERQSLVPDAPSGVGPGVGMPPMIPPHAAGNVPAQRTDASRLLDDASDPWHSPDTVPPAPGAAADPRAGDETQPGPVGHPTQPPTTASWALPAVMPLGITPHGQARQGGSSHADDEDDDGGIMPPLFLPALPPVDQERRPSGRTEAGELLQEQDSAWDPDGLRAEVPDEAVEEDRVAVVVDDEEDDFHSWDSADLPWVADTGTGSPQAEEQDDVDDPSDWGTAPVLPPPGPDADPGEEPVRHQPTYTRRQSGERLSEADHLVAEGVLPAVRSGGPDLTDEQREQWLAERAAAAEAAERERLRAAGLLDDEDGEAKERRAADLLNRDDKAWGGSAATSGMIG
jgi:hypothetical protein